MAKTDELKKFIVLLTGFLLCLANEINEQNILSADLQFQQKCGVRMVRRSGRIFSGQDTYNGKWPWHVLVKAVTPNVTLGPGMCGGALISSKYIITAAHCRPKSPNMLIVVLGEHDLTDLRSSLTYELRVAKKMFIHRGFNSSTYENDLAILEIEPVHFGPHIAPICLPRRHEDFTGKMAFVTGWGKLTHEGNQSLILQEVQVPVVTDEECEKMFLKAGYRLRVGKHAICAGYSDGGRDSCQGDSGGPLMVQRSDSRWVLVGIVSYGIGCAEPNQPSIHTRIDTFRSWIDHVIRTETSVKE